MSPFPWSELFLKHINGIELENYYRWLALTYVVTLATNPSISLPCGLDHKRMPFGLQVLLKHHPHRRRPLQRDKRLLQQRFPVDLGTLGQRRIPPSNSFVV